jgi:hypothetical protein
MNSNGTLGITLSPITGQTPNAIFNGNIIHDVIRDATTEANGDIWSMINGSANSVRGVSIDNTDNTGKRPGVALRAYGGSTLRGFMVGELARGSVATPTAVQSGNTLLEIAGSGYNGTQWVTDALTVPPVSILLQAAENWTSPAGVNTANGSRLRVDAQPTGTTATALTRSNIINHTPNAATYRSDAWTFATRETTAGGANQTLMSLAVVGSGGTAENTLTLLKADATASTNQGVINFNTFRSVAGTYSPTQSGDQLGQYKFNGNTSSTTTPSVGTSPALSIGAVATENWTISANGTKIVVNAIKNGATANTTIIDHAPTAAVYKADSFAIQTSAGVPALATVPITGFNSNTDFAGNIVKGALRTGNGEANGNVYEFLGAASPSVGVSIDNTDKVTARTSLVMRNYGGQRNTTIWEQARGTVATPTNVLVNDSLGEIQATGYTSTGWSSDLGTAPAAVVRLRASENWNNGLNNTGTQLLVVTQPTATALSAGSLVATLINSPATTSINSNTVNIGQGSNTPTGGAILNMGGPGTTGGGYLQLGDVNIAQMASSWQSVFSPGFKYTGLMSSGTQSSNGSTFEMSSRWKAAAADVAYVIPQNGYGLGKFSFSADNTTTNTNQVVAGEIRAKASENWSNLTTGTKLTFNANKKGAVNDGRVVLDMSPELTDLTTDVFNVFNTTNAVASYGNVSNMRLNAGDPAGATFNDRTSQLRVTTASTSAGDASTIVFNTNNFNTGTGLYSASASGDTLGEFFFSGNYSTGSSPTTLGPSVRFAARAAETFTGTNSGGQFVISADKIGGNIQYDAMTIDSANASIASDTITLESNTGTDYAIFNSTSATLKQPLVLSGSTSGYVQLSAPAVAGTQTYTLPTAYPADDDYRLVSTTAGVMSWAPPGTGFARGSFIYTGSVVPASANVSTILPLNTTLDSGITLDTSISGTGTITVAKTGIYAINLNVQVNNTDNGQDHVVFFWLRKNGADVAYSATDYTIIKSGYNVASLNFLQNAVINDTFELYYQVDNVALEFTTIPATTTPTAAIKPVAPSIVVNLTQVG